MKPSQTIFARQGLLPAVMMIALLALSACQSGPVARAAINQVDPSPTAVPTKPAIVYTVAAPTEPPSFSLVSPEEVATAGAARSPEPTATIAAAPSATATATLTPTPTATATATPPPTFTPPALPLTSSEEHYWLRRPVPDGGVVWTDKSYPYGNTKGGTLRPHHGVEFGVPRGTEILAAASGTVIVAGSDAEIVYGPTTDFYGNLVVVELDSRLNGQPVYNLYGHLSEILVSEGEHVDAQQTIALSGSSGVADGPHLHFEVRVGQNSYDQTRNPLLWLYPFPDRGAVAGRVLWPSGELVYEAPIRLRRVDAPSAYAVTTTYAATGGVNADEGWKENFAFDDVVAGYYEVIVSAGESEYKAEVWVFPYRTSFVEIVLDAAARPAEE